MPLYEYRCRECDTVFDARRPVEDANLVAVCPDGHPAGTRLLSVFAAMGRSSGGQAAPAPAGPCGGACACFPG